MGSPTTSFSLGSVPIPAEIQQSVGVEDGAPLTVSIQDGVILLKPVKVEPIHSEEAWKALEELRDLIAKDDSNLEDDLIQFRKEEEENWKRKWG